ncbi:MAG: ZIP family metal transporter [Bacteroidota bacterium]
MHAWEYLLLWGAAILGGWLAYFLKARNDNLIGVLLSFSGAYLIGIVFTHLLPEVYEMQGYAVGGYVLLGYFLQLLLESLSKGLEHGHIHAAHKPEKGFLFSIMIGLGIHAFMEGIPLSGFDMLHDHDMNYLLFGIVFHKLPAAFALVLLLLLSGYKERIVLICLLIFSILSPLGAFLATFFGAGTFLPQKTMVAIVAVVIGSFLHIGTTILFESGSRKSHKINPRKLIAVIAGFGLSLLSGH